MSALVGRTVLRSSFVQQHVHDFSVTACEWGIKYVHWGEQTFEPAACAGLVKGQVDDFVMPLLADEILDDRRLCTFLTRQCDQDKWAPVNLDEYVYDYLADKPEESQTNDYVNRLYESIQPGDETMRIALITDFHIDYDYTVGNTNVCSDILCCRSASGLPQSPENAAGKWGDYNCDIPERTLTSMLGHVRDVTKPDAVFWLGDSIPHNVDTLAAEPNAQVMQNVTKLVTDEIVSKGGIPLFATPGNHDTYPQDMFKNFESRDNPIFNEYAPLWDALIPDEKAMQTFLDYGYFALPLMRTDGTKAATVLSINSNLCYAFNFEAGLHVKDPVGMLGWIEEQLQAVEAEGGAAILISHVPNGYECVRQVGKRFHAILDKYQHVVRFQTTAHVHQENFQIVRDLVEHQPISMNFLAGAATTYTQKNPSFMVMTVDSRTMLPVELETHFLNITKANEEDDPQWEFHHKYTDFFGLKDLSPVSFMDYAQKVLTDAAVAKQYRDNRFTDGPAAYDETPCDFHDCRKKWYCQITASDFDEYVSCASGNKSPWLMSDFAFQLAVDKLVPNWFERTA